MKFAIKDFFSKCDQICTVDLVTFTEEILNGKLHFLCSQNSSASGQLTFRLLSNPCIFNPRVARPALLTSFIALSMTLKGIPFLVKKSIPPSWSPLYPIKNV